MNPALPAILAVWLVLQPFATARADQQSLEMKLNAPAKRTLELDWPLIHIGTGEYPDGPTGLTVFHFQNKVLAAIDVRGGGPGTVNAPYLEIGYDYPELDTVVFAGGSWYGLEAVTAVASALKDDGIRDGNAFGENPNIALSVGSIIFDFGSRRLNEIYPDKRLAQAAFRAARPGWFPQGAYGAGRFAKSGSFFGCNVYSGQGGAMRTYGDIKVAAFTVVNAVGVVTQRDGRVAACRGHSESSEDLTTAKLLAELTAEPDIGAGAPRENTTISLVVVNQAMDPAELKRLAVQVHTSMARAIQPFATIYDGDVLYAVSTAEITDSGISGPEIGVLAAETMWDAILASVPEQPAPLPLAAPETLDSEKLAAYTGEYVFSAFAAVRITLTDGKLHAQATAQREVYAIPTSHPVSLQQFSANQFGLPGADPVLLQFEDEGRLVLNPGHWQQVGRRHGSR